MIPATIREVNGSLAISIPRDAVKDLNLHEGSSLDVTVEGQEIVLKPRRRSKYTLQELLDQCDPSIPLSEEDKAWEAVPPVGREII